MLDKIKSGTGDDMYIANENFFGQKANLLELDDVMEMEVYGEEGGGKSRISFRKTFSPITTRAGTTISSRRTTSPVTAGFTTRR